MTKTVLVSGAGTGIGKAIAIALSTKCRVILCGRRASLLEKVKEELAVGHDHIIQPLDVTCRKSLMQLSELLETLSLSVVIANHGVGGENHYGESDRFDEIISTNLKGTYSLVNTALNSLKTHTSGYKNIIVISSILAKIGVPGYSAYCASKAGLLGLVRSWAVAFAHEKILVNGICPGWVNTEMAKEGLSIMSSNTGKSIELIMKEQMDYIPLGKMSEPQEIASLVCYLIDHNSSITGQSIDINNGAFLA